MKKMNYNLGYKRTTATGAAVLVATIGIIALLDYSGKTSILFNKNNSSAGTDSAKTTSNAPSAQQNFTTDKSNRDKTVNVDSNTDRGGATVRDTGGQTSVVTPAPKASSTGEITVYAPSSSSIIVSGQEISGESKLQQVSYRIIDNVSGVIGTGTLSVVNGKFSGKISFSTTATEGRIDIYGIRDDLSEYSNVEINVRFK